jgi:hypothetical protein
MSDDKARPENGADAGTEKESEADDLGARLEAHHWEMRNRIKQRKRDGGLS